MKLHLGKRSLAGLAASMVVVLVVIATAWRAASRLEEIQSRVTRSHEMLTQLSDTLSDLQDVETGGRGFIITGEEPFLEPYYAALQRVAAGTARLNALVADRPAQARRVEELQVPIADRIAITKQNIAVRREQGFVAAQQMVLAAQGKQAMDRVRAIVTELAKEENQQLVLRQQEEDTAERGVFIAFLLAGAIIIGLLAVIGYLINRDLAERQQAEAALRRERDFSAAVLDSLPGVLYCYDQNMQFRRWNKNFERVLGYTAAEIAQMQPLDFFAGPDREKVAARIQEVFARGESAVEADFVSKDGRCTPYYFTGLRTEIDGQPHLVGVGVDISTRQRAETALLQSERSLTEAQRIAHIGSWRWDLVGPVQWTEELYRVYGVSPETFTPTVESFFKLVHPEDQPALREWLRACSAGENPDAFEFRAVRPDGAVRCISGRGELVRDATGRPIEMVGTAQDITARKESEAALRESEARLRLAAEAANIGLWDWNLETNTVFFSREWKSQIGYREEEIANDFSEWQNRVHPDDLAPTLQKVAAFVANPQGRHEVEFRLRHKDGSYRWIYTNADVTRGVAGKPARMLGCHIDITERKRAEATLRALTVRLQAVREEERTRIARELHDELGQALTGLKFDLAWLARKLGPPGPTETAPVLREKAAAVTQAVDATIQLVRRIASELRPGVLDALGLVAALEWQAQEFEKRTGIRCTAELPDPAPPLNEAHATALFRIFQEALTNVARHAHARRVTVTLTEHDETVELKIADDGRGITDVNVAGTKSLGLLGMRERAAAAGGTMELRSAVGKGTTVIVRVPKA